MCVLFAVCSAALLCPLLRAVRCGAALLCCALYYVLCAVLCVCAVCPQAQAAPNPPKSKGTASKPQGYLTAETSNTKGYPQEKDEFWCRGYKQRRPAKAMPTPFET